MARCKICHKESNYISSSLGLCVDCIRQDFNRAKPLIAAAHQKTRRAFNLPLKPPRDSRAKICYLCINRCQISNGGYGFCGLRQNVDDKLTGVSSKEANLSFYHDPLPTNCVADWVCPAGTGCGYPDFAYADGPEYGYKNLAVFYHGCSFNCLFCQNWHYREELRSPKRVSAERLAAAADSRTACICYFGGDPTCQLPHSIHTSQIALKQKRNKILRVCWETNGSMNSKLLKPMAKISLESGGCIKFDLKTYTEELNIALCGVSNRQTLANFSALAELSRKRPEPPFLVASTLLVPGYIDADEVSQIARFIASLNPDIPYSLLAFYPCFYFRDLPTTPRKQAEICQEIAKKTGLKKVRIGNVHLLSDKI